MITVTLNSAATIEDVLDSVAAQTYTDREHIIVDGGSVDTTMDIVNRRRDTLGRVISEPDRGIYDAMNKGIAAATGDIVGFLNSDDVFAGASALQNIAETFEDPSIDACYSDLVYVGEHDLDRVVRYWKSNVFRPGQFRWGWMPAHPTFYVRRSVYRRLGGYDLEFSLQADFELATRFLEVHRIRSRYIPQVLVKMRLGGATNSSLGNILKGNLEAYRACRKNGLPVTPWFMVRKVLSRVPQFFLRPVAARTRGAQRSGP